MEIGQAERREEKIEDEREGRGGPFIRGEKRAKKEEKRKQGWGLRG